MIQSLGKLNNNNISIDDLRVLKSGEGIPFLISLDCDKRFIEGNAIMKVFGKVIIKYADKSMSDVYYSRTNQDTRNGFEKFKADVELFQSKGSFYWLNSNKSYNLDLLELMPDFHGSLLKNNRKAIYEFMQLNKTFLKLVSNEDLKRLNQIYELLKN
jgi:hypothetical protein